MTGKPLTASRLTLGVLRIAKVFVDQPARKRACPDIARQLGMSRHTVFSTLEIMTESGWLQGEREHVPYGGRAPRRMFWITERGLAEAKAALETLR